MSYDVAIKNYDPRQEKKTGSFIFGEYFIPRVIFVVVILAMWTLSAIQLSENKKLHSIEIKKFNIGDMVKIQCSGQIGTITGFGLFKTYEVTLYDPGDNTHHGFISGHDRNIYPCYYFKEVELKRCGGKK